MAGARFDILFAGDLIGGADPGEVRRRLQQRFNLPDEAAASLFSGNLVSVRVGVDTATASRYREIFREAGALVQIRPVAAPSEPAGAPADESAKKPAVGDRQSESPKQPGVAGGPEIDSSHLSLVQGQDWTLEDCQPPPATADIPSTDHLELVTPAPDDDERED